VKLLSRLPKTPKRHFVPQNLDATNLSQLIPIYKELLARPLPTIASVEKWLQDIRELAVVLQESESLIYIRKSVNTRDRKAQAAYMHLIQKVDPGLAPYKDKLNQKLISHPLRAKFPKRWKLMLKSRQNAVDLFRQKNVPLEQKVEETALRYSQIMGRLEVQFEGRKQTVVQMGVYLERPDRSLRQRAWETIAQRRYEEKSRIDQIYDQLIRLRTQIAKNARFRNFRDYCHQKYDRFDYTPQDCFRFHEAVEEVVVPAVKQLRERRARDMGLDALRPWDLAVDPLNRPPLNPFRKGSELAQRTRKLFQQLDPELAQQYRLMQKYEVFDLDNRPGKEPGGYQTTLSERQLPFIFMNAVGRDSDVRTFLHEAGHAFHMLATREEPILDYRHAPIEFCEVASMGMELLANKHMKVFYPQSEDYDRSTHALLEGTLDILPWVATIDAFQHWIYTHPNHTRSERVAYWMKLRKRFGDGVDWSGYRKFEEVLWHRQLHLFGSPFYYIEYGIAQLGALMVWYRSLQNRATALNAYKRALRFGGSVGLKELFRAAGGKLDFRRGMMKPLVQAVMERLS
jgi:oligoendopeptidase F